MSRTRHKHHGAQTPADKDRVIYQQASPPHKRNCEHAVYELHDSIESERFTDYDLYVIQVAFRKEAILKRKTKVVIARGFHLFPFRTEKLSPATLMVLRKWESK